MPEPSARPSSGAMAQTHASHPQRKTQFYQQLALLEQSSSTSTQACAVEMQNLPLVHSAPDAVSDHKADSDMSLNDRFRLQSGQSIIAPQCVQIANYRQF
ncbi:hypothetical protein [Devosia sp. MC1541]|uniref:hypothetical protein n=1 Tax=Devosia sp. MC1541 TaxID=2725264 RepID=UPI00145F91B0|nr:hypothetical protein [Devosia sp. MC1541]